MPTKIFLVVVGLLYLGLAIWCSFDPQTTSAKVGFELQPGSGESEFVTVYGGLELGMALIFFLPLVWNEATRFSGVSCLLIHACLVLFRTISFFNFAGIDSFTYRLAIGEWVILLVSVAMLLTFKSASNPKRDSGIQ